MKLTTTKSILLSVAFSVITGAGCHASLNKLLGDRVHDRDYPSIFQAWNPVDMPQYPLDTLEKRLETAAKHDLLWEEPVSQLGYGVELVLGAVWDHKHGGLAKQFTEASLSQALQNRAKMLFMNPNMVFLMEVRWRDAPDSFLPEDSEFWKRNPDGSRVLGWDGGPEPYYMLDYDNTAFQENIARQAKICIDSGVYDGIMLDWSGHLPVVKTVRQAIGDSGLIIVNIHDDMADARKYQNLINGAFMELNPADDSPNPHDNKRNWARVREALLYFETNFLEPQVNCLEVWGDRKDLSRMRATTCLGLTHSDGYVLYADPNPLSTPDHLHDWYAFWDVPLGKPTGALQNREDGAYQRRFEAGIVVYNPFKNGSIKVTFDKAYKQVSTGTVGTQFTIADRDGDIFLDQESPNADQKPSKHANPNPTPGNPIVETLRAADPDAHVWNDVVWVYTSQDQEPTPESIAKEGHGYSKMDGYHVFSSTDMVNWTDHGEILHSRDVSWGTDEGGWMWAPGAAFKDGTYYLYFPHHDKNGHFRIGVATSQVPQGPFSDTGHYIEGTNGIDPMCFVDDDGQAYLYFGPAMVAKLKENMTELAEKPRTVNYGSDNFREGAFVFKRKGIYYYTWTDWKGQEYQGYYAMGDSPYGPFTYKGPMNPSPPGAQDHHSIIEYHGQWYYFYHVGNFTDSNGLPGKGNRRNTCVDYLYFNEDGTMQMVEQTRESVKAVQR